MREAFVADGRRSGWKQHPLGVTACCAVALCLASAASLAQTPQPAEPALAISTLATVSAEGRYGRVDLVDGGIPGGDPSSSVAPHPARRAFLRRLMSFRRIPGSDDYLSAGRDLNGDLTDEDGDGIPETGFDSYLVGLAPRSSPEHEARIIGANNLYDLVQTTHGSPNVDALVPGFSGFTGGDIDGDGVGDGGPGLFSNAVGSVYPTLAPLPHVMGAGRGGQAGEQHQFLQVVFPFDVDASSLFDPLAGLTSFLDPAASVVEARWVERVVSGSLVDQTSQHRHVSGVAILGGVCALPVAPGSRVLAVVDPSDPSLSGIPIGARERVFDPNVLTYIAHENPAALPANRQGSPQGFVDRNGILHLPDATGAGPGGRVFGANQAVPDAVNDYGESGDQSAARIGFVHFAIDRLRDASGRAHDDTYFHTFEVSQAGVGADPAAPPGGFSRGPAIVVDAVTGLPDIEVLSLSSSSAAEGADTISVHSAFRIRFDKEVVPDSVGFSRRHSLHSVPGKGVVLPFKGNLRPKLNPSSQFVLTPLGSRLTPSIYLALNQPTQVSVNNPYVKDSNGDGLLDDGVTPIDPTAVTQQDRDELNGLYPAAANGSATLPRAVVPCDIYPVNQNNLQSYIVEPLVELPPGSVITLGVCLPGLGTSILGLSNRGNFTESGTVFARFQDLDPVGLPDPTLKQDLLANQLIIKVNAGPMDLTGQLFYGGTTVAIDTLIDGDPANDETTGGVNVARTYQVDTQGSTPYVNAPVSPEALYALFDDGGAGVLDLNGRGLTTNAPGGALTNPEIINHVIVSRLLEPSLTGAATPDNWVFGGSLAGGDHQRAFGITSRYTSGGCVCIGESVESELAIGAAVPTGPSTPVPGVNEGSSGPDTFVRDSFGQPVLTAAEVGVLGDIVVGGFLDSVLSDIENPYATSSDHRTINDPNAPGLLNNSVADPPVPNPPPLTFPVGLPLTSVFFNQFDLARPPTLIRGAEVFSRDTALSYTDGSSPPSPSGVPTNALIQLVPTGDPGNPNPWDLPASVASGGYSSPYPGEGGKFIAFHQTGPVDKYDSQPAALLAALNSSSSTPVFPGGIVTPVYQSRQQIGNYLFVTDRTNGVLHALNSNTMEVIESLDLPDPWGVGLSVDMGLLFVSNRADNSLSIVRADPRAPDFMTEIQRVAVGVGPTAVAVSPDGEDVFVVNTDGDTISILDASTLVVRKTLASLALDEPMDICLGMREVPDTPGFSSGTYHGFIANAGGDNVLIYESGPGGVGGIGADDIIGAVTGEDTGPYWPPVDMQRPTRVLYDPVSPLDVFDETVGCFVLHTNTAGQATVSRMAYTKDSSPGVNIVLKPITSPSFGGKVFQITQTYNTGLVGEGLDLALPDFDREEVLESNFGTDPGLYNFGALPPSRKAPVAFVPFGGGPWFLSAPRWDPGSLYVSVAGHGLVVFYITTGQLRALIPTPQDVVTLSSFFEN